MLLTTFRRGRSFARVVQYAWPLVDQPRKCQGRVAHDQSDADQPTFKYTLARTASDRRCSTGPASQPGASLLDRHVIYRGPWLLTFRLLIRLKIAQLGCVVALALPVHTLLSEGSIQSSQLMTMGVLFTGCAVVATTMFYFSRRYIGELALVKQGDALQLCISTLDFWGNRQDSLVALENIVPILDDSAEKAVSLAQQAFVPLSVAGDRQFLLSLRHGKLVDRPALFKVLHGRAC